MVTQIMWNWVLIIWYYFILISCRKSLVCNLSHPPSPHIAVSLSFVIWKLYFWDKGYSISWGGHVPKYVSHKGLLRTPVMVRLLLDCRKINNIWTTNSWMGTALKLQASKRKVTAVPEDDNIYIIIQGVWKVTFNSKKCGSRHHPAGHLNSIVGPSKLYYVLGPVIKQSCNTIYDQK